MAGHTIRIYKPDLCAVCLCGLRLSFGRQCCRWVARSGKASAEHAADCMQPLLCCDSYAWLEFGTAWLGMRVAIISSILCLLQLLILQVMLR